MTREEFIKQSGLAGAGVLILNGCDFFVSRSETLATSVGGVVTHFMTVHHELGQPTGDDRGAGWRVNLCR